MKPLNPILKTILEQRVTLPPRIVIPKPSYKLPPKPKVPNLTEPTLGDPEISFFKPKIISPTSSSVEITPSVEAQISGPKINITGLKSAPISQEQLYVFPDDEYEAAMNSIISTENTDPGFVSTDDVEKVSEYFKLKVLEVVKNKQTNNLQDIFSELMQDPKLREKIIGSNSTTLQTKLMDTIADTIAQPIPLKFDTETPSELAPLPQLQPQAKKQIKVDLEEPESLPGDQTIVVGKTQQQLKNQIEAIPQLKLSPLLIRLVPKKTTTDLEDDYRYYEEEEGGIKKKITKKKKEGKPFNFDDLEIDPIDYFLDKKSLGQYSGYYEKE